MSEYRIEDRTTGYEECFDSLDEVEAYIEEHFDNNIVCYETGRWGDTEIAFEYD